MTRRDRYTRRAVLAGAGALGAGVLGSVGARAAETLTVATRNGYLGADLFALLAAAASDDTTLPEAVGDLLTAVDRSHVGRRLGAIADELARTGPALVGVQEAALVRTGEPSDGTTPTATTVRYDFRDRLLAELAARDLPYRVVATTETTDIQLPATVDGERLGVRLTDRDLILAREGVTTRDSTTGRFDATLSVERADRTVTVRRGYGVVDATVGDRRLTFCNTHLESVSSETRQAQGAELRDLLAGEADPTVLVGDLNSGPGAATGTYDALTETFADAAPDVGHTCCHAADLRNAEPSLDARVDHVLVRGALEATDATRVGADPERRIAVEGDRLWPSDHAGVVATLAPATPTATATATPQSTESRTPTVTDTAAATITDAATATPQSTVAEAPGFGVTAALSALVAALAARRGDD